MSYDHQSGAFHLPRLGAQQSRKQRGNSAKFLPWPRLPSPPLACTWRPRSSKRTFPSFLPLSFWASIFPSWRSMSPLSSSTRREREREREKEAKTNLHSWVCIRWMSVGEGGREGARRKKKRGRPRRGEARRRGGERPKSERGMHELKQRDRGSSCSALLAALRGVQVHAAARFEPLP